MRLGMQLPGACGGATRRWQPVGQGRAGRPRIAAMFTRRGHRTVSGWIAMLAILMVTLMPAATGAFAGAGRLPWDRICSAANVAADKSGSPDSPATPHAFEHCPYCALHADLAPPPDPRLADARTML